ncbi:MAG: GlsB/YeaQ/YmgE family stress response membrane protein [Chloroflexota bacterium]
MGILAWIVLGLIAGALAKLLMPGSDPGGIIVTILLGIGGAIVGGFLWSLLTGNPGVTELSLGSILIATLGAIVLLVLYRLVMGRRASI